MNLHDPKEPIYYDLKVFEDNRGSFRETYNAMTCDFASNITFIQQNVSINKHGVLRGLHYQLDNPQSKLVTVLYGYVIDFIVDLRHYSPNFGKTYAYELSPSKSLWVPAGFAHGFLSLDNDTIFSYNVFGCPRVEGDEYSIDPFSVENVAVCIRDHFPNFIGIIMSDKDRNGMNFTEAPKYEM